jgi:hypothetical protein
MPENFPSRIIDLPGGFLNTGGPLSDSEVTRLLLAVKCGQRIGVDPQVWADVPPEGQAILLRLDIRPRTGCQCGQHNACTCGRRGVVAAESTSTSPSPAAELAG